MNGYSGGRASSGGTEELLVVASVTWHCGLHGREPHADAQFPWHYVSEIGMVEWQDFARTSAVLHTHKSTDAALLLLSSN